MPWIRANGSIYPAAGAVPDASPASTLAHGSAPLAVLIGPRTASSGEMSAVAFIGRARARTFGALSAGFTTANQAYPLSDGAMLVVTETTIRDRTGRDYAGPIRPDVPADDAEQAAEHWLAGRCA
ncbi:MAG TPA: S41 family peptidase [Allosphingosinicella sp.]|nr:S41 family peptidase [Allosphingosinicella sp.]